MTLTYTQSELETRLAYWQSRLHLSEWRITIKIERARDMSPDAAASVYPVFEAKEALIKMRDPVDWESKDFPQNHEETLVHELLHLHIDPISDADSDKTRYMAKEQAIEQIARALTVNCRSAK